QVAQLAPEILGILFAVARHKVFVVLTDAQYFPHGKLAELAIRLAALHPSGRHEVDTGVVFVASGLAPVIWKARPPGLARRPASSTLPVMSPSLRRLT